jgi:biofilm PGA synthesis protein PgaD
MAPLIIAPERASPSQRALSRLFTAIAWAAYMWLIAPLLTSLAWLLGVRSAWIELSRPLIEGTGTPGLLLPILAGVGAGLLLLWGELNRWRFTGVERRHATPPVTDAVVAKSLGAPQDLADRMRKSFESLPVIVLQMNEQAEPEGFTATLEPPKPLRRIMK